MSDYSEKVEQLREGSMTQTPMPRYQCHKKVWALKIAAIEVVRPTIADLETILQSENPPDLLGGIITPADAGFAPFGVTKAYMDKFEEGYTKI